MSINTSINSWSTSPFPSRLTLDQYLDRYLITFNWHLSRLSVKSRLTCISICRQAIKCWSIQLWVGKHSASYLPTVDPLLTECQSGMDCVLIEMLIECWPRVAWGYRLTLNRGCLKYTWTQFFCETVGLWRTIWQYMYTHCNYKILWTMFFLTPRAVYKGTLCDAFIETWTTKGWTWWWKNEHHSKRP